MWRLKDDIGFLGLLRVQEGQWHLPGRSEEFHARAWSWMLRELGHLPQAGKIAESKGGWIFGKPHLIFLNHKIPDKELWKKETEGVRPSNGRIGVLFKKLSSPRCYSWASLCLQNSVGFGLESSGSILSFRYIWIVLRTTLRGGSLETKAARRLWELSRREKVRV